MTLVHFDLASQTGWAAAVPPYRCSPTPIELAAGAQRVVHAHGSVKILNNNRQPFGKFLLEYEIWFRRFFDRYQPTGIFYEMPFSSQSQASSRVLLSLAAIVEQLAYRQHIPIKGRYRPNDIKKHATGKGNAKKHEMVAAAYAVGWVPRTEDEADALWGLDYGIAKLPRTEREIGHDIRAPSAADAEARAAS